MSAILPVPIEFDLPPGWESVSPDEYNAPNSAFLALHRAENGRDIASMTVSGAIRTNDVSVSDVCDEAVANLQRTFKSARLVERSDAVGEVGNLGMSQVLAIVTHDDKELMQCQAYLSAQDLSQEQRQTILEFVLTCGPGQFPTLIDDFQSVVSSVRASD